VYYIIEGSVGIYLKEESQNGAGKEYRIGQIGGGNFLGEMSYLLKEARTATAKTEESTLVLALPPRVFEEILQTDSQTARGVINSLSERLKNTNKNELETNKHEKIISKLKTQMQIYMANVKTF